MLSTCKLRFICALALSTVLLVGAGSVRLAAQGATGTILGTVSDSSGGVVPNAKVQVTNTGTSAIRATTSDDRGRYNLPELPVGRYQVSAEATGFQKVVQQGITLNPGANVVADFALLVGQVSQTVTVESNVSQVETTSAALSNVVQETQMRDLPLNGRNFEELILLAPGASVNLGTGATKNSFTGTGNYVSVSGSRMSGQGEILDGTDIQNYQNRGSGSGILGTSVGVDAIAEFSLMTNTYSARYGGNGAVVNAVTRSGTNSFHGSAYEFIRNSALDAKNFSDRVRQPFKKNQFGGTLGGPIKKDKMFFFVNYEGIRQNTGLSAITTIPDTYVRQGYLPASGAPANCNGPIAAGIPAGYVNCGVGSTNYTLGKFQVIQPYLIQYPDSAPTDRLFSSTGAPSGTASISLSAPAPGAENYLMGRYDWNINDKDSLFTRYVFDNGTLIEPFYGAFPQWPENDRTRNQYVTIGEKHIFSTSIINALNLGYTRTFLNLSGTSLRPNPSGQPNTLPAGSLDFEGDLFGQYGEPINDNALSPGSGVASLGANTVSPIRVAQTKISIADDVFWSKGAHSVSFGGSAIRIQTNKIHSVTGGTWTFQNLGTFLTDAPSQFNGPCHYNNGAQPACVFPDGTPFPKPQSAHDYRETQFALYVQDDWKVTPTLTLNLGVRYAPASNAWDKFNNIYRLLPLPDASLTGSLTGTLPATLPGPVPAVPTPVSNVFQKNPSFHNIDPRIGLAWDPFKDHKTSIRAGYGIFHLVQQVRDYSYFAHFAFPWITLSQTSNLNFPYPFQIPGKTSLPGALFGSDPYSTTPYMQQWNLTVQREVMKNTVVTVSYVGSHGTHLITQQNTNPPVPTGGVDLTGAGGATLTNGQLLWPSFPGQLNDLVFTSGTGTFDPAKGTWTCTAATCALATANHQPVIDPATGRWATTRIVQASSAGAFSVQTNTHLNPNFGFQNAGKTNSYSIYNALQAGLVRRMTNNFSLQVSYTYSNCIDVNSGNWSLEGGSMSPDPYNLSAGRGPCMFMIRHNFSTNGLYAIPFKGNRLVSGWQLGGIFYFSTGGPISVTLPSNLTADIGQTSPTYNPPNYVPNAPGCNGQPVNKTPTTDHGVFYLNAACFAAPPVGEIGNLGRNSFFGPKQATFNTSVQKNTQLTERFNLQFRWEVFNLLNRKNFYITSYPAFTQGGNTSAASVGSIVVPGNFGQLTQTSNTARQMQFGLKLIF